MKTMIAMILNLLLILNLNAGENMDKLPTEKHIEIGRYLGRWYSVLSLPQFFTRKCEGQLADYQLLDNKTIFVVNSCIKDDGSIKTISGKAVVKNQETNAELEVTFDSFWTKLLKVKGDYNILKITEDYDTVLVGSNDRKSLWILNRTGKIEESVEKEFITYAKTLGFKTQNLVRSTKY